MTTDYRVDIIKIKTPIVKCHRCDLRVLAGCHCPRCQTQSADMPRIPLRGRERELELKNQRDMARALCMKRAGYTDREVCVHLKRSTNFMILMRERYPEFKHQYEEAKQYARQHTA